MALAAKPVQEASLPPYTASLLGPVAAQQAVAVRLRLRQAGILLPPWVDARPGSLQVLIGDCAADRPLSRSAGTLALVHGARLLQGLAALALAAAAPRVALLVRDEEVRRSLLDQARSMDIQVEIYLAPRAWPSRPELDVPGAARGALCVSAQWLDRAGAALRTEPPHALCTVAGAIAAPGVVDLNAMNAVDPSRADPGRADPGRTASWGSDVEQTPAQLVRLCGGATVPAWVAIAGGAPGGALWEADVPVRLDVDLLLILPVGHELVRRLRTPVTDWLDRAASLCSGCRLCTDGCPEHLRGAPLSPHAVIQSLLGDRRRATSSDCDACSGGEPTLLPGGEAQSARGEVLAQGLHAHACTGCGVCDVLCPAGLSPLRLLSELREGLRTDSFTDEVPAPAVRSLPSAQPRVPLSLLVAQLGLDQFS